MNPINFEWVFGGLLSILFGLLTILFNLGMQNRAKLNAHEVKLAKFDVVMDKLDTVEAAFKIALDKHEVKEDRQFQEMSSKQDKHYHETTNKIERLMLSVALLKKSDVGLIEP